MKKQNITQRFVQNFIKFNALSTHCAAVKALMQ